MNGISANESKINKYVSNGVLSRPPELLVLDMYDGCLKFLNIALNSIEQENLDNFNTNLIKARAIVTELKNSLNFEKGGEIAKNLDSLYLFVLESINNAIFKKEKDSVNNAIKIIQILREAWSEGVVKNRI